MYLRSSEVMTPSKTPRHCTAARAAELELDLALAAAPQQDLAHLLGQPAPRRRQREAHGAGEGLHHRHADRAAVGLPRPHRAGVERALGVDHHLLRVDAVERAEAGAGRAGAVGAVEGEQPRRDLRQAGAAVGAGPALRQRLLGGALDRQRHQPVADLERGLQRVGDAALDAGLDHQAVDHHVDRVLLLLVEVGQLAARSRCAVDADADEALLGHLRQLLLVLPLLAAHVGGVEHQAGVGRQQHDAVDHLLHGLRADDVAALGAVRHADAGEEQAQVVVNLGHRAHRRARFLATVFCSMEIAGDSPSMESRRLLHLLQELPRVGRHDST